MSYLFKTYFNGLDGLFNDNIWTTSSFGSDTLGDRLKSDGDSYIAKITVPGVSRKELSIEATQEELTVSKDDKVIRRITLDGLVDIDEISSELDLGVLTIKLPKKESQKPKKVKIN